MRNTSDRDSWHSPGWVQTRRGYRNLFKAAAQGRDRSRPASTRTAVGTTASTTRPRQRRVTAACRWATTRRCFGCMASASAWTASLSPSASGRRRTTASAAASTRSRRPANSDPSCSARAIATSARRRFSLWVLFVVRSKGCFHDSRLERLPERGRRHRSRGSGYAELLHCRRGTRIAHMPSRSERASSSSSGRASTSEWRVA